MTRRGKIGVITAGIVFVATLLLVVAVAIASFFTNPARTALQPIDEQVLAIGGTVLSTDEDNGRGLFNHEPWVQTKYSFEADDGFTVDTLNEEVRRIFAESGYSPSPDSDEQYEYSGGGREAHSYMFELEHSVLVLQISIAFPSRYGD